MSSEVEETLKRLIAHKGVIGTIVVNNDGIPIKSTLDNHTTTQYAGLINQLVDQVRLMMTRQYGFCLQDNYFIHLIIASHYLIFSLILGQSNV